MKVVLPWLKRIAGVVIVGAAAWYLVRLASDERLGLAQARLTIAWAPLLLGSALTLAGYALNVRLWSWSLRWWEQRLPFVAALRIWFLANLARFVPGAIWQFAGLAAMSRARGVSAVAATSAILLQQVALLATGVLMSLAFAPDLLVAWGAALPRESRLGALATSVGGWAHALPWAGRGALVLALFAVATLVVPRLLPLAARLAARLGKAGALLLPRPGTRELAAYLAAHALTWSAYGIAFWLFCRALAYPSPTSAPSLAVAVGAFLISYVAGILVVFAPGGLGVREAVLTALLAPVVGPQSALLLSLLSRVWLVATELAGALGVLALTARGAGDAPGMPGAVPARDE